MKLDGRPPRRAGARPTRTPAASRSTRRRPCVVFVHGALHDHSVWTLRGALVREPRPRRARARPARPRPQRRPAARQRRGDGRLAARRCSTPPASAAARARRPQHGLADRARGGGARAGSGSRTWSWSATAYPMEVSAALLDAARDDPLAAIDSVNAFSHSTPGRQALVSRARAPGCTARTAR